MSHSELTADALRLYAANQAQERIEAIAEADHIYATKLRGLLTSAIKRMAELEAKPANADGITFLDLAGALGAPVTNDTPTKALLDAVEALVDAPESIPVAELADVLGCDADARTVRQKVSMLRAYTRGFGEHWDMIADAVGVDRSAVPVVDRGPWLANLFRQAARNPKEPKPDAEGWYVHDGETFPHCAPTDWIHWRSLDNDPGECNAARAPWADTALGMRVARWRYADGRDIKPVTEPDA